MDTDAYRDVVLRSKDRVHSYASWILKDREEARDVSQEVLVRLWNHRDTVREEAALSWLLRVTYRLCIDRTRRRKVRGEVHGENLFDPMPDHAPGPARLAESTEVGGRIADALGELSDVDRAAVLLREVQGMAYDEIARTLDIPIGTLKAKLHRSRDRLRRHLVEAGVTP